MNDEYRVTDPETGGQKGQKLARYDLIPAKALRTVAEQYGHGASKYDARNWERGYAWSLSFAALQRHAWAFWSGQDNDEESGLPHLAAVIFHALALMTFADTHPSKDDRPNQDGDDDHPESTTSHRPGPPPAHPPTAHTPTPSPGLPLAESQVWPAAGQRTMYASSNTHQRTRTAPPLLGATVQTGSDRTPAPWSISPTQHGGHTRHYTNSGSTLDIRPVSEHDQEVADGGN